MLLAENASGVGGRVKMEAVRLMNTVPSAMAELLRLRGGAGESCSG